MTVIFNGTTVLWIAVGSLAAGWVLGAVSVTKVINFFKARK